MSPNRSANDPGPVRSALRKIALPSEVSEFEAKHLRRMNRVSLYFFGLHLPVFMLVALFNRTGVAWAGLLTAMTLVGPTVAYFTLTNPRMVSVIYGVTAMFMGGLLVHFGQGPLQIEMHFYFFALIAMLAVYGNPAVVLAAAGTVAVHHLVLWFVLPRSVFNYEAPLWIVAVHTAFVVLESIATCFIARSFFDNVIGLEKIVKTRTDELDTRNQAMRLVLDNVRQGFVTIDREGRLSPEYSAIIRTWFGAPTPGMTLANLIGQHVPIFGASMELGWEQVVENVLPSELTLLQMPSLLTLNGRHLRFEYCPIGNASEVEKALVMISDVTSEFEQARSEMQRRQSFSIFERLSADRAGFLEFVDEATRLVDGILQVGSTTATRPIAEINRMIHTLKGNCGIFGIEIVTRICKDMETLFVEEGFPPAPAQLAELGTAWKRLCGEVHQIVGARRHRVELDDAQYQILLDAAHGPGARPALVKMVEELPLEPMALRLGRIAEQARGIGRRVSKGNLEVIVEDHEVRLDPRRWSSFWCAFVHVVRNAVDHGIETPEEREAAGKSLAGRLHLRSWVTAQALVIEIEDDGRGIDWEKIRSKARALGMAATSESDLLQALFHDGVTTLEEVGDISGRGVGLGAALAAARALAGDIAVHSDLARGTRLQFRFPLSQTATATEADRPMDRAAAPADTRSPLSSLSSASTGAEAASRAIAPGTMPMKIPSNTPTPFLPPVSLRPQQR